MSEAMILQPADPGYDEARFAFDLADLRPAAACVAHSVAEVQGAIAWARDNGLKVATLATGHRAIALPPLDDALLLKPMINETPVIDAADLFARVGAGTKWRPVVDAAAESGLAGLHGSSPTVGVVGYILGGGLSFYSRQHGLACNRVRSIEVVTADGELARIDNSSEPDLFWALRGAGGWSAVVTAVEIDLLPVADVFAGATFWPVEVAEEVLSAWLDWTRSAPDSVTTSFRIMNLPPVEQVPAPLRGQNVVTVDGVALDNADGQALAARLEGIAETIMTRWGPMAAAGVAGLHGDPEDPLPALGSSTLVDDLDDEAISAFVAATGGESGSSLVVAELRQLGGSLRRGDESGGVADRIDAEFIAFGVGVAGDPEVKARTREDLDRMIGALKPWENGRDFFNFADPDVTLERCFGPASAEALRAIRYEYDPEGLFVPPLAG